MDVHGYAAKFKYVKCNQNSSKMGGGICEHHVMVALPDYKGFFLKFIY